MMIKGHLRIYSATTMMTKNTIHYIIYMPKNSLGFLSVISQAINEQLAVAPRIFVLIL